MVRSAVIVDAVRTPLGQRHGKLQGWHPVELAAFTLRSLVQRNQLDPALIDDVIMGCVMQVGEQALNIGRNAVLGAGFPESVPSTTVDRQCGSSQQAIHFAAQGVMAGAYDIVIAAGVESMSRVPVGASVASGPGTPFSPSLIDRYGPVGGLQPQGIGAELIAERWGISREDCDRYSVSSHHRAAQAATEGRFDREIVAVEVKTGRGTEWFRADEGVRAEASAASLNRLRPAFRPDGIVTSANAGRIADGAAAVLIMSEAKATEFGLRPIARFHTFAVAGVDPVTMLTGPIAATAKALAKSGLDVADFDVIEVNESFAAVVLAWEKELHPDMTRVNINGGAIAIGHPLGCSGARVLATLLWELDRRGGRYGLQTMSEGGGMANAMIIERL